MVEVLLGFEKCSLTVDFFAIMIAFSAASLIYKKKIKQNKTLTYTY